MFSLMRSLLVGSLVLSALGVSTAAAQLDYYGRAGATFSTALVKDRIIDEIEIKPELAPTLAFGAALPIAPRYRAGLEAAFTTGGYSSEEAGVESDLGTLRTGSLILALDGPVTSTLRWRAGVGLLGYFPSEERGIFLSGGTTRFLAGAGLDYRYPVMTRWDLMASLRYDFHRFTTNELQARGFSQHQGVQRISASIGLARAAR
jgi:hypothetical protein